MLTVEDVSQALPANLKYAATQELTDIVNSISADPIVCERVRENFISFASVLKHGKFKTTDYVNACAYVSYKLMGYNNVEAYARTFPQRYTALRAKGVDDKTISSYVSGYHKGRLVSLILERSVVPSWVLNQDIYQKAINTQVDLMLNAKSEKVRGESANSLLTHLKKPEKHEVSLDIGITESSGMTELKEMLNRLAESQRDAISKGASTKSIAHQTLHEMKTVGSDDDEEKDNQTPQIKE